MPLEAFVMLLLHASTFFGMQSFAPLHEKAGKLYRLLMPHAA
jgi:hypothetical protein